MELAEYYGGRRRMPMRMMGGAHEYNLKTMRDGTVVPYVDWKECAQSNWKNRKIACNDYRKNTSVIPEVSYKNWKECAQSNWKNRKSTCAKYKKEKKQLKYPELAGKPVAERMAFLRSLKVKGKTRKYKRGCNALGISNMKATELKALAKQQGIRGYSKMKKAELCALFQSYN